jgi:predicted outer membrane protein
MDRRNALTLLAIAIAAPTTARAAGEAPIGDAEKEHAMHTLAVGSVSLETARVAEQKAENSWVKKFAQYEVAEQTTIAEILKSTGATAAKLTDKQLEMIQKIKDAKAGARFDEEFLADQLAGHHELLNIQDSYIEKGKDEAAINLSKLARAQIKEHIDLIETIRKDLKA